jgi:hypothetical protein
MVTGHVDSKSDPSNLLPPRLDFVTTDDNGFQLNFTSIQSYESQGYDVLVGLNNNPQNAPQTESCEFMGADGASPSYTQEQRIAYVTQLAQDQTQYGFVLGYPVFFPLCPAGFSYDAAADGIVPAMVALMNQYDPVTASA